MLAGVCLTATAESDIVAPPEPLITVNEPSRWTVGIHCQIDDRELKAGDTVLRMDAVHAAGRLGCEVTPFVDAMLQIGWSYADIGQGRTASEGERGLEWSAGCRIRLLEYVVRGSPVVPHKESLFFAAGALYTSSESNFQGGDFSWDEFRVTAPSLVYIVDHGANVFRKPYHPAGVTLEGGLVFSRLRGTYGSAAVTENRDFGFLFGSDVRFSNGWSARLDGTFFGTGDRSVSAGLSYYF